MAMSLPAAVRDLLEGKNFAHVATLMRDGSPQVSVVWIDVDGDRILVNTAEGRTKPANVRHDPRVAISIVEQENPYRAAFIRGRSSAWSTKVRPSTSTSCRRSTGDGSTRTARASNA